MHLLRKTRRITMFIGAGAVGAYFLDPDNGMARRRRLIEQIQGLSSQAKEVMPTEERAPGADTSAGDTGADDRTAPRNDDVSTGAWDAGTASASQPSHGSTTDQPAEAGGPATSTDESAGSSDSTTSAPSATPGTS